MQGRLKTDSEPAQKRHRLRQQKKKHAEQACLHSETRPKLIRTACRAKQLSQRNLFLSKKLYALAQDNSIPFFGLVHVVEETACAATWNWSQWGGNKRLLSLKSMSPIMGYKMWGLRSLNLKTSKRAALANDGGQLPKDFTLKCMANEKHQAPALSRITTMTDPVPDKYLLLVRPSPPLPPHAPILIMRIAIVLVHVLTRCHPKKLEFHPGFKPASQSSITRPKYALPVSITFSASSSKTRTFKPYQ